MDSIMILLLSCFDYLTFIWVYLYLLLTWLTFVVYYHCALKVSHRGLFVSLGWLDMPITAKPEFRS